MPFTSDHVSAQARIKREATTGRKAVVARSWDAKELAHAIRIAAKMAAEGRNPNPLFIEALKVAASYFDELDLRGPLE